MPRATCRSVYAVSRFNDRSRLIRYDIRDYVYDDVTDNLERNDKTFNVDGSTHTTLLTRTRTVETATDRFTRAASKASRVVDKGRLDLTDTPDSLQNATTRIPARKTRVGAVPGRNEAIRRIRIQALLRTLGHYGPPHPGG